MANEVIWQSCDVKWLIKLIIFSRKHVFLVKLHVNYTLGWFWIEERLTKSIFHSSRLGATTVHFFIPALVFRSETFISVRWLEIKTHVLVHNTKVYIHYKGPYDGGGCNCLLRWWWQTCFNAVKFLCTEINILGMLPFSPPPQKILRIWCKCICRSNKINKFYTYSSLT